MKKIRCAIYTRKSSEDGLEQEFNSLDAQREACAAYVASQKHEGWVLLPTAYDDGGLSGGSLDRPALQRLMQDMRDGLVDQIIVYKIDRLTRSLADFSKIVDVLDAAGASFVSVTQSFNTATSMGRLTLNMLLSFAQFEREVTAERIRDKIAASKRKGLWMGGLVPFGYDAHGRTLAVNTEEAVTVRTLYDLYEQVGTLRAVTAEADRRGLRTRRRVSGDGAVSGGGPFTRGHVHQILTNPLYAGRIRHRKTIHEGQHPAIIDPGRWERVQQLLQDRAARTRTSKTAGQSSRLCGKLFDETGERLTPSHTKTKSGARLRYYVSNRLIKKSGEPHQDGWRLPSLELEERVAAVIRSAVTAPGFAGKICPGISADAIASLGARLDYMLQETGGREVLAMVARADIAPGSISVVLDQDAIADGLNIALESIDNEALRIAAPFQIRKRGVETKLILGSAPTAVDETLLRNIAKAHRWFGLIKSGRSFAEIASAENTSKRRVQQMIDLAFLAPDVVRDVLEGAQPIGFTSDWCKQHTLPSDWNDQRALIATL